jgi:hypothetical protein
VCWAEEIGNGKSFLFRIHHRPVLHALINVIAPYL